MEKQQNLENQIKGIFTIQSEDVLVHLDFNKIMDIVRHFINYNLTKEKSSEELAKELLDIIELEIGDISTSEKQVDFEKLLLTCGKVINVLKTQM